MSNGYDDDYTDLDGWGGQAKPEHAFTAGLDTVPDGEYDGEFLSAELTRAGEYRVCRCNLRLGGRQAQHTYFLNTQNAVNGFLAEMMALGFPANDWGGGPKQTPLSVMIPACVAKLPGIKFRAAKTSREDTRPAKPGEKAKIYHNLFISERLSDGGGSSARLPQPPKQSSQPAKPPRQQQMLKEEQIPF